jgi:hypothetical protein
MKRVPVRPGFSPHRREGARRPDDDEAWWRDVLHDPRARAPRQHYLDGPSRFRLDQQNLRIECRCRCGLTHWMDRDMMIEQVGGDINVLYLVREWMPCRTRNKMANFCEAYVVI